MAAVHKFLKGLNAILMLQIVLPAGHAAAEHPSLQYWNSAFPNTPMPTRFNELLHKAEAFVNPGKDETIIITSLAHAYNESLGIKVREDNVPRIDIIYQRPLRNDDASHGQDHQEQNITYFFLEKDLRAGKHMTTYMGRSAIHQGPLLPRTLSERIPFSYSKIKEIGDLFSFPHGSLAENTMMKTLQECETSKATNLPGEKHCVTSLESMIDLALSQLGTSVRVLSLDSQRDLRVDNYTLRSAPVKLSKREEKSVPCHAQTYPYAIFYCHSADSARLYSVPLLAESDRSHLTAVAVCHTDTTGWDPMHKAFKDLKLTPGNIPICHFQPQGDLLWVPF